MTLPLPRAIKAAAMIRKICLNETFPQTKRNHEGRDRALACV